MKLLKLLFIVLFTVTTTFVNGREYYTTSYNKIDSMLNSSKNLNLKEAVFWVENAYFDLKLDYEKFKLKLRQYATFVKAISANGIIDYRNIDSKSTNIHAAIFYMMTDTIAIQTSDSIVLQHLPFQYNFQDYAGRQDWSSMFVSTLMAVKKGNCHSLPLFYKLITEEIGEKSWIALAPNHAYIKLYNEANGWYNVELTSGQFPTDAWIKASGYIHTDAIRNGIYRDTVSLKSTVAICITDLAEGYINKYGMDKNPEFVITCCNRTLEVFPNYVNALLLKAETMVYIYNKTHDMKIFNEAEDLYKYIHQLGYRKMPDKMYQKWIKTLENHS